MPRGSLHDFLHGQAGQVVVDTAQAVRFALDIARGMAYLHSLERIIPEYHLNSYHIMVRTDVKIVVIRGECLQSTFCCMLINQHIKFIFRLQLLVLSDLLLDKD